MGSKDMMERKRYEMEQQKSNKNLVEYIDENGNPAIWKNNEKWVRSTSVKKKENIIEKKINSKKLLLEYLEGISPNEATLDQIRENTTTDKDRNYFKTLCNRLTNKGILDKRTEGKTKNATSYYKIYKEEDIKRKNKAFELFNKDIDYPIKDVIKILDCTERTYYRYKKEFREKKSYKEEKKLAFKLLDDDPEILEEEALEKLRIGRSTWYRYKKEYFNNLSTRQQILSYLKEHPDVINNDLYEIFPEASKSTLRDYKSKFLKEISIQKFKCPHCEMEYFSQESLDYHIQEHPKIISVRQTIFRYLNTHPEINILNNRKMNNILYQKFPDINKTLLRKYKQHYFDQKKDKQNNKNNNIEKDYQEFLEFNKFRKLKKGGR